RAGRAGPTRRPRASLTLQGGEMNGKELLRQFRATTWANTAEVENFVYQAGQVAVADMIAMLQVLIDRNAAQEGKPHGLRCMVYQRIVENSADKELFVPALRAISRA